MYKYNIAMLGKSGAYKNGERITSLSSWSRYFWDHDLGAPFCDEVLIHLFSLCPVPQRDHEFYPAISIPLSRDKLRFHINTEVEEEAELEILFQGVRNMIDTNPELKQAQALHQMKKDDKE